MEAFSKSTSKIEQPSFSTLPFSLFNTQPTGESLPDDAKTVIWGFLHPREQAKVASVAKSWRIDSLSKWLQHCQQYATQTLGRGFLWDHLLTDEKFVAPTGVREEKSAPLNRFDAYLQHVFPAMIQAPDFPGFLYLEPLSQTSIKQRYNYFKRILNKRYSILAEKTLYPDISGKILQQYIETCLQAAKALQAETQKLLVSKAFLEKDSSASKPATLGNILRNECKLDFSQYEGVTAKDKPKIKRFIQFFKCVQIWLRQTEVIEQIISDCLLTHQAFLFQTALLCHEEEQLKASGVSGQALKKRLQNFALTEARKYLTPLSTRRQTAQSAILVLYFSLRDEDDSIAHALLNPKDLLFKLIMTKLSAEHILSICSGQLFNRRLPHQCHRRILAEPALTRKFSPLQAATLAAMLFSSIAPDPEAKAGDPCDLHYVATRNPHFIELMNQPIGLGRHIGWMEMYPKHWALATDLFSLPLSKAIIDTISLPLEEILEICSMTSDITGHKLYRVSAVLELLKGHFSDRVPYDTLLDMQRYLSSESVPFQDRAKAQIILDLLKPLIESTKPRYYPLPLIPTAPSATDSFISSSSEEKQTPTFETNSPRGSVESSVSSTAPLQDHGVDRPVAGNSHLLLKCLFALGIALCIAGAMGALTPPHGTPLWAMLCLIVGGLDVLSTGGTLLYRCCYPQPSLKALASSGQPVPSNVLEPRLGSGATSLVNVYGSTDSSKDEFDPRSRARHTKTALRIDAMA